jgi:hypothetical protein
VGVAGTNPVVYKTFILAGERFTIGDAVMVKVRDTESKEETGQQNQAGTPRRRNAKCKQLIKGSRGTNKAWGAAKKERKRYGRQMAFADFSILSPSSPPPTLFSLLLLFFVDTTQNNGSALDFIAEIKKIFTDANGEVYLDVVWFYRPEV